MRKSGFAHLDTHASAHKRLLARFVAARRSASGDGLSLATLDAAPASWLMNIEGAAEAGLDPETVIGTLIAIAPVIGTARVVSAAGHIIKAFELAQAKE